MFHLSDQTVAVPSMHLLFHSRLPICHPQPHVWPQNYLLFPTLPISKQQVPVSEVTHRCVRAHVHRKTWRIWLNEADTACQYQCRWFGVLSYLIVDIILMLRCNRKNMKRKKKKTIFSQVPATILCSLMLFFIILEKNLASLA